MNYENLLLKIIIEEPKFFKKNKNILKKYKFKNKVVDFIYTNVKEHYDKYGEIPTYDILNIRIDENIPSKIVDGKETNTMKKQIIEQVKYHIKDVEISESERKYLMDNLKNKLEENMISNVGEEIHKIDSDKLHSMLIEIDNLKKGDYEYEVKNLWDYDEELEREVIPTGIELIDNNGGVGRGEIGIMLASTGIGKSVFLSFMANQLMLRGLKVLHIVFEGATNDYIRLHRVKLGNPTNDMLKRGKTTSNLKVVKMFSGKTSLSDIQDFIEQLKGEGFTPDAICLDYLDLLAPTKIRKENWMSEINTSNELEEFCWRNNLVFWTAVQTNRSGLNNEIPDLSQMAGSVSKGQKATMVLGVSRSNLQIDDNKADVAIIKNRYGKTAQAHNINWNPNTMEINITETENIILG